MWRAASPGDGRAAPLLYHSPITKREETRAHSHPRHDPADGDHRVLSAAAVVRPQPRRPLVQVRARQFAVSRAISRRRLQRSSTRRRPPGSTSSPTATAASTSTVGGKSWFFYPIERLGGITPSRHFARLDVAPRPASGQDPVGGAGGLPARRRSARSSRAGRSNTPPSGRWRST